MAVLKYKNSDGEYVAIANYSVNAPTVVQETGTSTTDVMSQNAVCENFVSNDKLDETVQSAVSEATQDFYTKEEANSTFVTSETLTTDLEGYQKELTAGDGISIADNVISCTVEGGVTNVTASGTDPLTLSVSMGDDNVAAITGSIAEASESQAGYMTAQMVADLKNALDEYTYNNGVTTATSVASVPMTYKLAVCTISADASFSLASQLGAGKEIHIIVKNTSSSDITVTLPNENGYVIMDGNTELTVAAEGLADINVVADESTMYIRAL